MVGYTHLLHTNPTSCIFNAAFMDHLTHKEFIQSRILLFGEKLTDKSLKLLGTLNNSDCNRMFQNKGVQIKKVILDFRICAVPLGKGFSPHPAANIYFDYLINCLNVQARVNHGTFVKQPFKSHLFS